MTHAIENGLQLEAKSAPKAAKAAAMKPLAAPSVSTTTTLIPKKKHPKGGAVGQNGAQSLPAKGGKKRIAPVLMQVQNNSVSPDSNIHKIPIPAVEESTLLESRMTKEPEQASEMATNGDAAGDTTIGDAVTISTFTVKPVEPKKTNEVSLKRKRDQERSTVSSTLATPSVAKAREVIPRAPKVLANRYDPCGLVIKAFVHLLICFVLFSTLATANYCQNIRFG